MFELKGVSSFHMNSVKGRMIAFAPKTDSFAFLLYDRMFLFSNGVIWNVKI